VLIEVLESLVVTDSSEAKVFATQNSQRFAEEVKELLAGFIRC
jgi:hypothetical protein